MATHNSSIRFGVAGTAVVFGVVNGELWGSDNIVLFWLGNISSTDLLAAFVAGRQIFRLDRKLTAAALAGMAVVTIALFTFYGWVVITGDLDVGSARAVMVKYIAAGLIVGPIFGALGGLQYRLSSWIPAVLLVIAFALEPLAWSIYGAERAMPRPVLIIEVIASLAILIVCRRTVQDGSH